MIRRSRRVLAATALVALLAASPVRAELEPGVDAPDVTAQAFINTEPVKLADLAGRVVFLELFSTT
jgi:hypothetical protein